MVAFIIEREFLREWLPCRHSSVPYGHYCERKSRLVIRGGVSDRYAEGAVSKKSFTHLRSFEIFTCHARAGGSGGHPQPTPSETSRADTRYVSVIHVSGYVLVRGVGKGRYVATGHRSGALILRLPLLQEHCPPAAGSDEALPPLLWGPSMIFDLGNDSDGLTILGFGHEPFLCRRVFSCRSTTVLRLLPLTSCR